MIISDLNYMKVASDDKVQGGHWDSKECDPKPKKPCFKPKHHFDDDDKKKCFKPKPKFCKW